MRLGRRTDQKQLPSGPVPALAIPTRSEEAIGAVAASVLTAAMLKNGTLYEDLGAHHFDSRAKGKPVLRLVGRIQNLGFAVQITPIGAAA
jgi:hypothetical protein